MTGEQTIADHRVHDDLADRLPIRSGRHILDIGCGPGDPGRHIAKRFQCRVSGVGIDPRFVEYADGLFDGAFCRHVTMNVADRRTFFAEVFRVLRSGAFFALTEHGLGPRRDPRYPVPWSEDGNGACLVTPCATRALLEAAGFGDMILEYTGASCVAGYRAAIENAEHGLSPRMRETDLQKARNAVRNIEEGRTVPIQVVCRKR